MSRNTSLRSTDSVYKGSINSSSSRSRSRNNRISRRSHNDSKTRPDTIIHQKVRRNRLISLSSRRNNKSVRILSPSNKYVNVICIPVNWLLPIFRSQTPVSKVCFNMSPPLETFPASAISKHIPRKLNTSQCPLKQLTQFECILDHDDTPICFPILRRFRVYGLFLW